MIPQPSADDLARDAEQDYNRCEGMKHDPDMPDLWPSESQTWIKRAVAAEKLSEAAEDALRSIACKLSVGGYQSDTVDAAAFERKIDEGLELLVRPLVTRAEAAEREIGEARAEIERLRRYIHDFETICDPTGMVQTEWALKENIAALRAETERLKEDLHLCNGTCDLALKHRDIAEQEIARLRALLGRCIDAFQYWYMGPEGLTEEINVALAAKVVEAEERGWERGMQEADNICFNTRGVPVMANEAIRGRIRQRKGGR